MGKSGCSLGMSGCSWGMLGCSWEMSGCSLEMLGYSWGRSGCNLEMLGYRMGMLGCSLVTLGCSLGMLGCNQERLDCIVGRMVRILLRQEMDTHKMDWPMNGQVIDLHERVMVCRQVILESLVAGSKLGNSLEILHWHRLQQTERILVLLVLPHCPFLVTTVSHKQELLPQPKESFRGSSPQKVRPQHQRTCQKHPSFLPPQHSWVFQYRKRTGQRPTKDRRRRYPSLVIDPG